MHDRKEKKGDSWLQDATNTVEQQTRRCEDSRKLRSPFWEKLREEVSHPQRRWEDETSKQARVRITTENGTDKFKVYVCSLSFSPRHFISAFSS